MDNISDRASSADILKANAMLEHIMGFVRTSRGQIQNGVDVDLTGLDTQVQEFCELVLSFPSEDALSYEESLQELSEELTSLQGMLEDEQEEVESELQGLNAHGNAAKAYKKSEGE